MPLTLQTLLVSLLLTTISACSTVAIDMASREHNKASQSVSLGDPKPRVLNILMPTQQLVGSRYSKDPDKYLQDGKRIEIYYMRSGRQADGLTTDDEFTPYVFQDDVLIAIGWAALGGAKSHGQVRQRAPVTNINVEQTMQVR